MRQVGVTNNTVLTSDTFMASLLSRSIEIATDAADYHQLTNILGSPCPAVASATTISGAMTNIPGKMTIAQFMNARDVSPILTPAGPLDENNSPKAKIRQPDNHKQ